MSTELRPRKSHPRKAAWLSELPTRWKVARLRHVLRSLDQGWSPNANDREATESEWGVLKLSAIGNGEFREAEHKALPESEEPDPRIEVRPGDVLLARANTPELVGDACYVATTRSHLMFSDLVYRIRFSDGIDSRFATYWLISRPCRQQIEVDARGSSRSMVKISQPHIRSWLLPVPPRPEQRSIADFLDRETAKIDDLIKQKQRLIELLTEKRTGLITQAVTKGLDPAVEMKDSGVEWLGEIPMHWTVARIKHVARLETGHTPSRQHPEYWEDCTVPWFGLSDVWQIRDGRREFVTRTKERISDIGLRQSAARLLPKGTVILSRTASVGFSAILGTDMATTQDFVNWVCGPKVIPLYLLYVFRAMRPEFRRLTMGSTHQTIYMPGVHQFVTPLPAVEEQEAIVQTLRPRLEDLFSLGDQVAGTIDLLYEYRTALISAAVTGKIDVRETRSSS